MFDMMLWCIWKPQNEKIWHNEKNRPTVFVTLVCDCLLQWQPARAHEQRSAVVPDRNEPLLQYKSLAVSLGGGNRTGAR
jgi:hypothetical protein